MNNMVDLHTHFLYGIDDGVKTIDEAIDLVNYLYSKGFTDIVATSHFIESYDWVEDEKSRLKLLKEIEAKLNNKKINLYLGNEARINHSNLDDLLNNKKISTINNSRYLLIDIPFNGNISGLEKLLCDLHNRGIVPILAHPERYDYFQKDIKNLYKILEYGCLIQGNLKSLAGLDGSKSKSAIKQYLKEDLVHIIATDSHAIDKKDYIPKTLKKLEKLVGKEKFLELVSINPRKVLNDEEILKKSEMLK